MTTIGMHYDVIAGKEQEFEKGFTSVIEHLKTPPDRSTLEGILARLPGPPIELVRTDDPLFRELSLDEGSLTTVAGVIDVLVSHPELMQRPVVLRGDTAVIARPPELVANVLD